LHCDAVRVTGADPERLEIAARHAADAGLEVWIGPFTCDLTQDEVLDVLADCAGRAEQIRAGGTAVVFVAGAEHILMTKGFLPGDTIGPRLAGLGPGLAGSQDGLNDFLRRAAAVVRERFGGPVTYASVPIERVDWTPFDIVGVDAYKQGESSERYAAGLRSFAAHGKPVAITEYGCVTYRGAAAAGGRGAQAVDWTDPAAPRLDRDDYVRDESEQVGYLHEMLALLEAGGVDSAFWCAFAWHHLPYADGNDLDLASSGLVRVLPDGTWEPKAAFRAMAALPGGRQGLGGGQPGRP
jgi:hypothetical protein